VSRPPEILLRPLWAEPISLEPPAFGEGHGGEDARFLHDIFMGSEADPLGRAASHRDGALSILTRIAASQAFKTGEVVRVTDLLKFKFYLTT